MNQKFMRKLGLLILLPILLALSARAQTAAHFDITKDEVKTLVGMKSSQLSVSGLRLAMTPAQARTFLAKSETLIGEADEYNPGRIYVYERTPEGKGKALLYLIWDGRPKMRMITVFADFKSYLTANFQKLLNAEALDEKSQFTSSFIGKPNRFAVTLDIKSIGLKHMTFYFDKIGLEVTRQMSGGKDTGVVFALVPSKL